MSRFPFCLAITSLLVTQFVASLSFAQQSTPLKVVVSKDANDQWQLIRDGQPYRVRGAGGDASLKLLAESGGNSVRTWGVGDETPAMLDDAHANGISVAVGIWLEHERLGMDYEDFDKVAQQIDLTLSHVKKLKNHPAILVWGVGNEMEIPETGDNPAVWSHIEHLARLIKEEDPNHPVMTVIAEIGGRKVEAIHKLCPSVDIIGINSYGGAKSLPERYRQVKGAKPYIVTEFGPAGAWEIPRNNIDTIVEQLGHEKAAKYRESYTAFESDKKSCLGSYAFLWGHKQEATATWFGMFLEDGRKTSVVDTMTELWSGKSVANRCPKIESLTIDGANEVDGGTTVTLKLQASDPEGATIQVQWVLMREADKFITAGDFQEAPPSYDDAILSQDNQGAQVRLPKSPGYYRVYAYVGDGNGASAANVPILVKDPSMDAAGKKVELPFTVYDEPTDEAVYAPSGFMGSTEAIELNPNSTVNPATGDHCLQVKYNKSEDWGGVTWQHPAEDWGDLEGGLNLSGARKLRFKARSETGTEKVKFGVGLIGRDKPFFDTVKKEMEVSLTPEWQEYSIDLTDSDLSRIKTSFFWSLAGQGQPIVFYLDDIVFE